MRAITLHQPWATLIALGVKGWETRPRPCPPHIVGTRIAIHAAARRPDVGNLDVGQWMVLADGAGGWTLCDRDNPYGFGARMVYSLFPRLDLCGFYHPMPGAVVCTAVVAESLPIVAMGEVSDRAAGRCVVRDGARLFLCGPIADENRPIDISGQLPYGDWTPGRWAWRLADVEPVDPPAPAKGKQGWWTWEP